MINDDSHDRHCDIAVIGAGFSGSVLGIKAAELGLNIRVFDNRAEYPDHFRAEKLETDQHEALEALGLIEFVRPREPSYVDQVREFVGDKERLVPCSKHRGMEYCATVNSFRSILTDRDLLEVKKVSSVRDTPEYCEIQFEDESLLRARLAIMATGGSNIVRKSLALGSHSLDRVLSTTFGFYVESSAPGGFPYDAFNVRAKKFVRGFQYITIFPVGDRTRVNVFTCWHPGSKEAKEAKEAKEFRTNPLAEINRLFPRLKDRVGPFHLSSKMQVFTTHYYRQGCQHLHSSVLVGDEYQSVSPATGMGISKCLTDARTLLKVIEDAATRQSGRFDLRAYYADEGKKRVDEDARHRWEWSNELATSRSIKTNLKKFKRILTSTTIGERLLGRRQSQIQGSWKYF